MADHPIPFDSDSGRRIVEITVTWLVSDILVLFPGAGSILESYFRAGCAEHPGCHDCPGRYLDSVEDAAWLSGAEERLEELIAELNESYRQWLDGEPFCGTSGTA